MPKIVFMLILMLPCLCLAQDQEWSEVNPEQVVEEMTARIAANPDNADNYYYRGEAFVRLNLPKAAILDFEACLEINPGHYWARVDRAMSMLDIEKYQEALVEAEGVVRDYPDKPESYFLKGYVLSHLNRFEESEMSYNKCLALDPYNSDVIFNRAWVRGERGLHRKAVGDYSFVMLINPDDLDAYTSRGYEFELMGNYSRACQDYNKACNMGDCEELERLQDERKCQ